MGDEERLTWTKTILFNPQSVITTEVLTFIVLPDWCPTVALLGEGVEWVQLRAVAADFQRRWTAPLASRRYSARTQQLECSVTKRDLMIGLGLRRKHGRHDGKPVNTHTMRTKEGAHIHTTVNLANLSGGAHSPSFTDGLEHVRLHLFAPDFVVRSVESHPMVFQVR